MVYLGKLSEVLEREGFEVVTDDNVLEASKEEGNEATEITIDAGGGCLVKKKTSEKQTSKKMILVGQTVNVAQNKVKTIQARLKLVDNNDLADLLDTLGKI